MLSGWGRYPQQDCAVTGLRAMSDAARELGEDASLIARGNGRSYGDAALSRHRVLETLKADRLIAFDAQAGLVTCEAGLLLADLLGIIVPRGWFVPVTPGTKLVTIGGMIAADVHGKNHHHAGTIGRHVVSLDLLTADGRIRRCSLREETELFAATCGGMGLTGVILSATLRLDRIETSWIRQETRRAPNLAEAIRLCDASLDWTYAVAWIDCVAQGEALGRSLVYLGEHAARDEVRDRKLAVPRRRVRPVPFDLPGFALNRWSVAAFNELYYRRGKPGTAYVDYDRYFYPLDALRDWNRLYGGAGFLQYQCVIPLAASTEGLGLLLQRIARAGSGSFLAVLKRLGPEGDGLLSFPLEGYTLALDFPAVQANFSLLAELDAITADHGGRIYLAKDARATAAAIQRGYPRLGRFQAIRRAVDPDGKFASLLSERLEI
jgi:FAD/FMN-containing dehydrogenase